MRKANFRLNLLGSKCGSEASFSSARASGDGEHDLSQLAAGQSAHEVLADYPYLEPEDIPAVLRYAAVVDRGEAGCPEDVVLSDHGLQVVVLVWLVTFGIAANVV